jgi:hypothetical protein
VKKIYTPIPGLGTGRSRLQVGMRNRLYSGPDHLLIVQSTGFTEDYKRIFYRDIRYVVTRKNYRYLWSNISLVVIIALFFVLHATGVPVVVIATRSAIFSIVFIINLVRGPTCDCYVSTDVQTLRVPAPQRVNKVKVFIDFLKTKVPALESAPAPT